MKEKNGVPHVVAATMTLELGIDISDVERIIHVDSPHAVSTFVQRLGRSGRVNNASEMFFAISENPKAVEDYKKGEEKSFQFLIGMVMRKSKGQADPAVVNKIMKELIG